MSLRCCRKAALVHTRLRSVLPQCPFQTLLRRARWSSVSQQPGSDQYVIAFSWSLSILTVRSVHFPGAVNSKFTTKLAFEHPSTHSAIPTYRVMDSDGVIVDKAREPADSSDEEVLTWYKDMVTGACFCEG